MHAQRILIIRLPCRKVYPTGPVYLLSLLRRADPRADLRMVDLALVEPGRRRSALQAAIQEHRPDVVAFSWRDMQIFSPQDLDSGLHDAFVFFYDPSPVRRLAAAFGGLGDIFRYRSEIAGNLGLVAETARRNPGIEIALGGPSVKIFGEWLKERLPERVGVYPDQDLGRFFQSISLTLPADPIEPDIDLEYLEAAFPQWQAYREETIGVQSKQGCPHNCLYCLYGFLEGKRVRRRDPAAVVAEVSAYARRWGCRRFWFADAQLLSEPADAGHLSAILEGLCGAVPGLEWGGYLRIHEVDHGLASLMVRSGLHDLEVSLNSGSQAVLDELRLGFTVEQAMNGFQVLRDAGYAGRVLVNLSLNAPGETRETLQETLQVMERIRAVFGASRVVPVVFFLAIQPRTGLEERAIAEGRIRQGYDPLSVSPWNVLKLIYNPPPLGPLIGRSCARAFAEGAGGDRILQLIGREIGAGSAGEA